MELASLTIVKQDIKPIDQINIQNTLETLRIEFESKFKEFCQLQGHPESSKYQELKRELLDIQVQRKELVLRG